MAERLTITDRQYLLDDTGGGPTLNSSIARVLLEQSPAHAYQAHPRLGGRLGDSTPAQIDGSAFHALLLQDGKGIVEIMADDYRKSEARDERDEALATCQIPVLSKRLDELAQVATRARDQLLALGVYIVKGEHEVPIVWEETSESGLVRCRAKLDHAELTIGSLVDIKTSRSAHPDYISKAIVNHGYHIQAAGHSRAAAALWPELQGRLEFMLAFIELEAPFAVTVVRMDGELRELGETLWQRAVERWAACLARDDWPGYARSITTVGAPRWALGQMFDEKEETA